ncbi:hypothetical protein G7054_g5249 [Neopestalotiopsis clavispora]|nr:hypothetical protein G7054_g5249 [Neopestalotiopsis clavispora]
MASKSSQPKAALPRSALRRGDTEDEPIYLDSSPMIKQEGETQPYTDLPRASDPASKTQCPVHIDSPSKKRRTPSTLPTRPERSSSSDPLDWEHDFDSRARRIREKAMGTDSENAVLGKAVLPTSPSGPERSQVIKHSDSKSFAKASERKTIKSRPSQTIGNDVLLGKKAPKTTLEVPSWRRPSMSKSSGTNDKSSVPLKTTPRTSPINSTRPHPRNSQDTQSISDAEECKQSISNSTSTTGNIVLPDKKTLGTAPEILPWSRPSIGKSTDIINKNTVPGKTVATKSSTELARSPPCISHDHYKLGETQGHEALARKSTGANGNNILPGKKAPEKAPEVPSWRRTSISKLTGTDGKSASHVTTPQKELDSTTEDADIDILFDETASVGNIFDASNSDSGREPTPEGFVHHLYSHQHIALAWMRKMEDTPKYQGGVLADEMGLGKTLSVLSLIASKRSHTAQGNKPGPTLILCPLSLLSQWTLEINSKMRQDHNKLSIIDAHDARNKSIAHEEMRQYDIVITTYDHIRSEAKKEKSSFFDSENSEFERIILEEGHAIKNHKTALFKAVQKLRAKYRWIITGTPIQNNVEEMYSYIAFLDIEPYNDWDRYKKAFRGLILQKKKDENEYDAGEMARFKAFIQGFMLHRSKDDIIEGQKIVDLPPQTVKRVTVALNEAERRFYEDLEKDVQTQYRDLVAEGLNKKGSSRALLLSLRLRLACCHPLLIANTATQEGMEMDSDLADQCNLQQGLDLKRLRDAARSGSRISHERYMDHLDQVWQESAKITKLMSMVRCFRKKGLKTLVFSQWTGALDLVEWKMRRDRIRFARLDGSAGHTAREEAIAKFRDVGDCMVMLISLRAGGAGLNLVMASRIILLDPDWNPSIEAQAIGRAHRIGQNKPVVVYRLLTENTIEDRVLQMQRKKKGEVAAAMGRSVNKDDPDADGTVLEDPDAEDLAFLTFLINGTD